MLVWSVLIFPCAAFEALVFICAINVVKKKYIYLYVDVMIHNIAAEESY